MIDHQQLARLHAELLAAQRRLNLARREEQEAADFRQACERDLFAARQRALDASVLVTEQAA